MIVKGFYLHRMSNDSCFRSDAQVQLSQCNARSTVLTAVVESHGDLKGKKVFAFGFAVRFFKMYREEPVLEFLFIVKLQPGIAWKKQSKSYLVNFTRLLLRDSYTSTSL